MTRRQLQHQAAVARFQAGRFKPPTRRQAQAWLAPIRQAFAEIKTGEVDAHRGYPITRLHWTDNDFARIDHAINGFVALIERLMPDLDIGVMRLISSRLANGVLLTVANLDEAGRVMRIVEDRLIKLRRCDLTDAANTEMIAIEFERMGLREAA